jgi:hypothetical protein
MAKNRLTRKTGNAKRPSRNKIRAQRQRKYDIIRHAQERAEERYALHLSSECMRSMREDILADRAVYLRKTGRQAVIYLVAYEDERYPVVFDPVRKLIVTVLPPHPRGVSKEKMRRAHLELDLEDNTG